MNIEDFRLKKNNLSYLRIEKARRIVYNYLLSHPCVDCGNKDPIVLTFDHLRDKEFEICNGVRKGFSIKRILNEMQKCEVRCANCHTLKSAKDYNWYRFRFKNDETIGK